MTFGVRPPSRISKIDAAVSPGTALCFGILVSYLAPHYTQWYGDDMPELTRRFLAGSTAWVVITAGGVIMQVIGMVVGQSGPKQTLWKLFDTLLALASLLIIIVGLIALALPLFLLQLPI